MTGVLAGLLRRDSPDGYLGAVERGTPPPTPDVAGRIYYQSPVANSPLPANRVAALKQYGSMRETGTALPTGNVVLLQCEGTFSLP